MKKIIISILAVLLFSSIPQPSHALPPDFIFSAHGIVTENGLPVDGAAVFVQCGTDGASTGTNADGSYKATFSTCFMGSTVSVWASKGDSFGTASVLGTPVTTLNVEITNQYLSTTIMGNVSDHGNAARGAKVTMKCGSLEKQGLTDIHGGYAFVVPSADCPLGSTVQVSAIEGNRSGTIFAVVQRLNNINIAIANVGIPEYDLLGGMLAAGAGGGMVALHRRRYARSGKYE